MTLPNREQATVPPEKLSGYLLSLNHPVGHSKALFFRALGFDDDNVEQLAGALLKIAQSEAVSDTIRTEYGVKYVISGNRSIAMIRELDTVALTHDLPEHHLVAGDVGAVVHSYPDGAAFEVEFVTAAGETVAVVTLTPPDIRLLSGREILHARELALAA